MLNISTLIGSMLGSLFSGGLFIYAIQNIFKLGKLHQRFENLENYVREFTREVKTWNKNADKTLVNHETRITLIEAKLN